MTEYSNFLEHFLTLPILYLALSTVVTSQISTGTHEDYFYIFTVDTISQDHDHLEACDPQIDMPSAQLVTARYAQGLSLWVLNHLWGTKAQRNCLHCRSHHWWYCHHSLWDRNIYLENIDKSDYHNNTFIKLTHKKSLSVKEIKAVVTLYNVGFHLHKVVVSLCENGDEKRGRSPKLLLQNICAIIHFLIIICFWLHFSPNQGANQEEKMRWLCSINLKATCKIWGTLVQNKIDPKNSIMWPPHQLPLPLFINFLIQESVECKISIIVKLKHSHGAARVQGGLFLVFSTQYYQRNEQE